MSASLEEAIDSWEEHMGEMQQGWLDWNVCFFFSLFSFFPSQYALPNGNYLSLYTIKMFSKILPFTILKSSFQIHRCPFLSPI